MNIHLGSLPAFLKGYQRTFQPSLDPDYLPNTTLNTKKQSISDRVRYRNFASVNLA